MSGEVLPQTLISVIESLPKYQRVSKYRWERVAHNESPDVRWHQIGQIPSNLMIETQIWIDGSVSVSLGLNEDVEINDQIGILLLFSSFQEVEIVFWYSSTDCYGRVESCLHNRFNELQTTETYQYLFQRLDMISGGAVGSCLISILASDFESAQRKNIARILLQSDIVDQIAA